MAAFSNFLRLLAIAVFAAALVHVTFGLWGESLLGADLSGVTSGEPNLDSQNRFYGAAFLIYGVILWQVAARPLQPHPVFLPAVGLFFCAGAIRLVSWALIGMPSAPIIFLMLLELLIPPIVLLWHRRLKG